MNQQSTPPAKCDMCYGSNHTLNGARCICLDGTQDGAMRGLRTIIKEQRAEIKKLQEWQVSPEGLK